MERLPVEKQQVETYIGPMRARGINCIAGSGWAQCVRGLPAGWHLSPPGCVEGLALGYPGYLILHTLEC